MSKKLILENCRKCSDWLNSLNQYCTHCTHPDRTADRKGSVEKLMEDCPLSDDTIEPWDLVPTYKESINDKTLRLTVFPHGKFKIIAAYQIIVIVGYNCDPSRDGETRVLKNGEWVEINEKEETHGE